MVPAREQTVGPRCKDRLRSRAGTEYLGIEIIAMACLHTNKIMFSYFITNCD